MKKKLNMLMTATRLGRFNAASPAAEDRRSDGAGWRAAFVSPP